MSQNKTLFSTRTTAKIVGVLFLIATASYMLGTTIMDSVLAAPDFLLNIYSDRTQVEFAVLLKFVTAVANIGIGVLLFTILKKYSETISLVYLVTKVIDGAGIALGGVATLSLISLSRETIQAGGQITPDFLALANVIVAGTDTMYFVTMIALGLGAMPFCYLLYRERLIPRAMALLGLAGYAALFAGSLLELMGYDLLMLHYAPGGVFEVIFPLYLIFKGFNTTAAVTHAGETEAADDRVSVSPA